MNENFWDILNNGLDTIYKGANQYLDVQQRSTAPNVFGSVFSLNRATSSINLNLVLLFVLGFGAFYIIKKS